jgi:hypothetical protein
MNEQEQYNPYESEVVTTAFNELMVELFGEIPKDVAKETVDAKVYKDAMQKIADKYKLEMGHPNYFEWIFTLVGRSPQITHKGEDENGSVSTNDCRDTEEK